MILGMTAPLFQNAMVLAGRITPLYDDYKVIGGGVLLLIVASVMRFHWLVTLTIFCLSITEIWLPGHPIVSRNMQTIARLGRWFLFVAIALKGFGAVLGASRGGLSQHPIRLQATLFAILSAVSVAYSMDRELTFAATLLLVLVFICAFVVIWHLVDEEKKLTEFVHAVYRAMWPLVVVSVLLLFMTPGFVWLESRHGGLFRNPNGLGLTAAMLFPLAFWEVARARPGFGRLFRIFILGCVFVAVIVSMSRSAMFGILMSGSVMVLYRYRMALPVMIAVAGSFLLVYVAAGEWTELFESRGERVDAFVRAGSLEDLGGRFEKWEVGWHHFVQKPIAGHGYGTSRIVPSGRALHGSVFSKAGGLHGYDFHSSHVQTAIELGIVGLLLLEIMLITVAVTGFSLFRKSTYPGLTLLGVALFASLMVMIGDTFVHGWLFSPGSGLSFIFWTYTALVARTAVLAQQAKPETEPGDAHSFGGE
jgi:O-antigen ligase